jgi:large subunit ribosomal protein L13
MNYTIDAANQKLGRLASRIASILQGKLNAQYEPRLAGKDRVTVSNASKIIFTGRKLNKKIYYRHTGYMGHLKKTPLKLAWQKNPEAVLRRAVKMMLPQNRLLIKRLKRLVIYD